MMFQRYSLQKSSDLLLVVGLTIVAVVVASLGFSTPIRVLFMLPFAFVLPGYAFVSALFPRNELSMMIRFTLAIPLSLATAAMGGLFLHFSAIPLTPRAWLVLFSAVTLVMSVIAGLRRRAITSSPLPVTIHFKPSHVAMVFAAVLMVFIAVNIARNGVINRPTQRFTQLWILPDTSNTALSTSVRMGIENHEAAPMRYQLRLNSGDLTLDQWDDIQLAPGEQWETVISLSGDAAAQGVEARLYRSDMPTTVYRQVSLAASGTIEPIGQLRP